MIKEALEYLINLGRMDCEPREVTSSPRAKKFLIEGSEIEVTLPRPARAHEADTLDDLIALANRFRPDAPVVWYDDENVVLVIDDAEHRADRVTFALQPSDLFDRLQKLRQGREWFDQKAFVRLLRVELAGTLDPVHLLDIVRRVRFENGEVRSSEILRQRESLGREIKSQVSADKEIPEEVTFEVPVFKSAGETEQYPLRCSVDVEPMRGAFQLLPLADELKRVQQLAVASIAERLRAGLDEGVPCYQGRP